MSTAGIKNALRGGATSIEHGCLLDEEAIALMKEGHRVGVTSRGHKAIQKFLEDVRDAAREVLTRLVADGGDPQTIVEAENLGAVSDGLAEFAQQAIAADPEAAERVRAGNMKAIGPLVGYVMRETKGRADGGEVTRLIREQVQAAKT